MAGGARAIDTVGSRWKAEGRPRVLRQAGRTVFGRRVDDLVPTHSSSGRKVDGPTTMKASRSRISHNPRTKASSRCSPQAMPLLVAWPIRGFPAVTAS
jgi:hypothetical protein